MSQDSLNHEDLFVPRLRLIPDTLCLHEAGLPSTDTTLAYHCQRLNAIPN